MQNSFPSPLHEMVVFKLDTKKLQNNLDFLFLHLSDTKSDLSNLKAEFVSDSTQVHTEITELSKLAPKVDLCLEKLDVALALKSKIDSWDSRFRSFEEKLFSIQSLTDDKFKDISLKFDVTINELEDSLNVKFTGQYEELDKFAFENFQRLENILNNEMQKRCTLKEVRDVFKQEARKTLHRSETMGARINFSINDHREIDEDVGLRSKNESDYEYERKLTDSNIDLETRGKSREGNYERQQHTQRNIRKIIKVEKVDSVVSESDESEKFETLESIDKLIIMDGTNQRQYEKSQQKNETINAVISNLDASPVQSRLNPSFSISATAFDNKNVIDYELLAKINDLGDDIYIKIDQINEEIKVVKKILPLKVFTAELEDILSKHNQPVPSPMKTESKDDKLKNLEERLNKMWLDLEKFRNNQENFHIIIEERLGSITSQILLKLEEKSTSTISKITEIHKNEISQSNKDSGELQVISSQISWLKSKIKEIFEVIGNLSKQPVDASPHDIPQFPIEDGIFDIPIDNNPQFKVLLSRLKYHDAFLKQSNSHVQKLEIEVEKIHDILSKQQEQGLTAYLIQLEELKGNVTEIMLKLQEGTRLSQRDFHKLNDLYALIEDKGNKDEILQKVDKKELKQAYRHLSKKIDSVQAEIKKFEETKLAHKSFDKATLFKQKPNSECLACGQDVAAQSSSAREWVSSGSFPAFSHSRFGPGFSKVLPLINLSNDLLGKLHQHHKSKSELFSLRADMTETENKPSALSSRRASLKGSKVSASTSKERWNA